MYAEYVRSTGLIHGGGSRQPSHKPSSFCERRLAVRGVAQVLCHDLHDKLRACCVALAERLQANWPPGDTSLEIVGGVPGSLQRDRDRLSCGDGCCEPLFVIVHDLQPQAEEKAARKTQKRGNN